MTKTFIYQVLPRLFNGSGGRNIPFGSRLKNGCGRFEDFDDAALDAISALGITHIWYTGVLAQATCETYEGPGLEASHPVVVKGRAGSPYAIRDYYDVSPELAVNTKLRMQEFEALIDRTHHHGMGVIIDLVPNHVAREYRGIQTPEGHAVLGADDDPSHSFLNTNDFYYLPGESLVLPESAYLIARKQAPELQAGSYQEYPAKATGNDRFTAFPGINDWYETIKLNYGQPDPSSSNEPSPTPLWHKMLAIMKFWAGKGIDGFRCDMAGMVPVCFWKWAINAIKAEYPHLLYIAEIYEPEKYQVFQEAGFDYLYDKVGFYDTLIDVMRGHTLAARLTQAWQQTPLAGQFLLRFIENHDEPRIASSSMTSNPGLGFTGFIAAATMHPGPVMLYSGQEWGVKGDEAEGFSGLDGRTSIFDYWSLPEYQQWKADGTYDGQGLSPEKRQVLQDYKTFGQLLQSAPALQSGHFYDLGYAQDPSSFNHEALYAFLRYNEEQVFLILLNFRSQQTCHIHIPDHALTLMPFKPKKIARVFPTLLEVENNANLVYIQDGSCYIDLKIPQYKSIILKLNKESA